MKKIILCVITIIILSINAIAQETQLPEKKKEIVVSFYLNFSDPGNFGLSGEYELRETKLFGFIGKEEKFKNSILLNVSVAASSLSNENPDVENIYGSGIQIDLGFRNYLKANQMKGFYFENFLSWGNVNFDEDIFYLDDKVGHFDGKYSFVSLINPDLGYKLKVAKILNLELNAGFTWKWEIKGQGDIDNKMFDNLVPKIGCRLGWIF